MRFFSAAASSEKNAIYSLDLVSAAAGEKDLVDISLSLFFPAVSNSKSSSTRTTTPRRRRRQHFFISSVVLTYIARSDGDHEDAAVYWMDTCISLAHAQKKFDPDGRSVGRSAEDEEDRNITLIADQAGLPATFLLLLNKVVVTRARRRRRVLHSPTG